MSAPRIYHAEVMHLGTIISLAPKASKHLITVLRLRIGDSVVLFNGQGGQFRGQLLAINKKNSVFQALMKVQDYADVDVESPLHIHLAQAISRADKMDYVIQKSVELGVTHITPLITERTGVKLTAQRFEHKSLHWQQIIISACEQCGRNCLPVLSPLVDINDWIKRCHVSQTGVSVSKFICHPKAERRLGNVNTRNKSVVILIGPEGGFCSQEVEMAEKFGFMAVSLGPRILRTETAALAAISVLQSQGGDF